jgi:hypothetical protein
MLITLLHAGAGALLAVWLALHAQSPFRMPMLLAAMAGAALLAVAGWWLARRALPLSPGRLRWDGQCWTSVGPQGPQPLQRLVVMLDLGVWVLLRLHPVGGHALWRVASAASAQAAWHGLRVALAAHAGATPAVAPGGAA